MKHLILAFFLLLSTSLYSKEVGSPPLGVLVGVGEIVRNNNRVDNNYKDGSKRYLFNTVPIITVNYGPLMIGANGITFSFIGDRNVAGYFNFNRSGDRYYGTDMDTRKESWMAGFGLKYHKYNILASKDISHRSNGTKLSLSYSEMYVIEAESYLRTSLALEFYNKKFANYYYGVRSNEVTSTRLFYEPKAYITPAVSAFFIRKLYEKVNGTLGISVKKISGEIIDSPTTNAIEWETSLITGLTWTFY